MISVLNTIKETKIIEEFKSIDASIICESLQCKLLQELAKQLKDIKADVNDKIEKEYQEKVEKWGSAYKDRNYNKTFREIFGNGEVRWDKITDSDISKIPAGDGDDLSRPERRQILDVIQSKKDSIIIIKDKEDKEFLYCIYTWGYVYQLTGGNGWTKYAGEHVTYRTGRKNKDLTNNEKIDLCRGKNVYFVDLSGKKEEVQKLRQQRSIAKSGMIMLDPDSLKKMADQNVERYKKIVRENKAKATNNDELITKSKKIITQVASYAAMVAKDPVRHADVITLVSSLTTWIYDRKHWEEPNRYRKQGYYSGVNGLLPLLMKYTDLIKDLSNGGGYEYQQRELKGVQDDMKKAVENAEKIIQQIEDKMNN